MARATQGRRLCVGTMTEIRISDSKCDCASQRITVQICRERAIMTWSSMRLACGPMACSSGEAMTGTLLMAVTTWVVAESQRLTSCSWADVD